MSSIILCLMKLIKYCLYNFHFHIKISTLQFWHWYDIVTAIPWKFSPTCSELPAGFHYGRKRILQNMLYLYTSKHLYAYTATPPQNSEERDSCNVLHLQIVTAAVLMTQDSLQSSMCLPSWSQDNSLSFWYFRSCSKLLFGLISIIFTSSFPIT